MQSPCSEVEMEKRKSLLRDFQNGLTHLQAKDNIVDQFGDCVGYGNQTCRRWFVKFCKGNFDLTARPRDSKSKDYSRRKRGKNALKPIKMVMDQEVTTIQKQNKPKVPVQQQQLPVAAAAAKPTMPKLVNQNNSTVQNLIQKKRELTISKVTRGAVVKKQAIEPNIITIAPSARKSIPNSTKTPTASTPPVVPMDVVDNNTSSEMHKLRPRRSRPRQSADQGMPSKTSTMAENQSTRNETKKVPSAAATASNQKSKNTEKEITVESQKPSQDVVTRNTARKKTEALNKRHTLPRQQANSKPSTNPTDNCTRIEPKETPSTKGVLKIVNVANVETICSEISKNTGRKIPEVINKLQTYSHLKPKNPIKANYGMSMTTAEPMDVSGIGAGTGTTGLKIANVANVQSIISEISKTAGRKIPEPVNKRYTLPLVHAQDPIAPPPSTGSTLNNQKGVIYLNPQQIFRQKFGDYKKQQPLKSPSFGTKSAFAATDSTLLTKITPFAQRQPTMQTPAAAATATTRPEEVTLIDSDDSQDTDDDLLFPENISLPAPKVKDLADTFTTYWDLDSCKPISMDEDEPVALTLTRTAPPPVIEID